MSRDHAARWPPILDPRIHNMDGSLRARDPLEYPSDEMLFGSHSILPRPAPTPTTLGCRINVAADRIRQEGITDFDVDLDMSGPSMCVKVSRAGKTLASFAATSLSELDDVGVAIEQALGVDGPHRRFRAELLAYERKALAKAEAEERQRAEAELQKRQRAQLEWERAEAERQAASARRTEEEARRQRVTAWWDGVEDEAPAPDDSDGPTLMELVERLGEVEERLAIVEEGAGRPFAATTTPPSDSGAPRPSELYARFSSLDLD